MKSILLIGLGRFGRHIARELNELGHQVMAIDSNEDRVNAVLSYVTNAQIGDSTSEYFLRNMAAKTAKPNQKNRFHTCLLYPIAIFSCGRREWAGLLPNAA